MLSPEETLPSGEISAFEESVFQDALHTTQSLDHVCSVVVQVPQFSIVPLVGPPERILLQHLHSIKTSIDLCMLVTNAKLIIFVYKLTNVSMLISKLQAFWYINISTLLINIIRYV